MNIEISNHAFKWTKDYDGGNKTKIIQADLGLFHAYFGIFRNAQELLRHIQNPIKHLQSRILRKLLQL